MQSSKKHELSRERKRKVVSGLSWAYRLNKKSMIKEGAMIKRAMAETNRASQVYLDSEKIKALWKSSFSIKKKKAVMT